MKCPICGERMTPKFRPFCSGRCADVDLAKWLNGSYASPSQDPEDIEAASLAAADAENTRGTTH